MIFSFIVVLIVMAIMSAFMLSVIRKLKDTVGDQIQKDVMRLVSNYDDLIEEKSNELQQLKKEIKEIQQGIEEAKVHENLHRTRGFDDISYHQVIVEDGSYIDENFFKYYALVENEFKILAFQAMEKTVNLLVRDRKNVNVHEFKEILALFDYSLQYEMYTLEPHEQIKVMEFVSQHSAAKKRILRKYIESKGTFDFKEFMDYIRDYIFRNDTTVYVYTHEGEKCLEDMPKHVLFKKDSSISIGYKIKYKDKLYDYSL